MQLEQRRFAELLGAYRELALISEPEVRETLGLFSPAHPLRDAMASADSVHVHVRVEDTARLPRARIVALGCQPESEQPGYVKFAHADGLNMIFSSIDVAEDDLIQESPKTPRPFLDHIGIDLRSLDPAVVAVYEGVPAIARQQQWAHVEQGGQGKAVYCCHTEVSGKHWLYPRNGGGSRPIEVASGPLKLHGAKVGCDLRPIDPAHADARKVKACCGVEASISVAALMPGR